MCRWLAYSGESIPLAELILKPSHSLLDQSKEARLMHSTTNGDGFGVGWYGFGETPGRYRSILPAWNDPNLNDLAEHVRSRLFMAHVRAATKTAVQQTNCHPFRHNRWLFLHNGVIREFEKIRRELMLAVDPAYFNYITGTTDSEVLLYLAMTHGMQQDPLGGLARMVWVVEQAGLAHGVENPLTMTVALSDGVTLYVARYASGGEQLSLYYSRDPSALADIDPKVMRAGGDAMVVVSEPLTTLSGKWALVPESSAAIIDDDGIRFQPFEPLAVGG